jgi:hypothetical protein
MNSQLIIKGVIPDQRIDSGAYPDRDQDLWQINYQPEALGCTAWFQLHGLDHIHSKHGVGNLDELAERSFRMPVFLYPTQVDRWNNWYMARYGIHAPRHNFRPFPIEAMAAHFKTRYFTGSYALLIAFALYLGQYTTIDFAGTDFWANPRLPQYPDEHWAVPCIEFWMGIAHAYGVTIWPDSEKTSIMYDPWGGVYGYEAGGNE